MQAANCHWLKQALFDDLASHTDVHEVGDICVVTLPYITLDRRWVDVFVEPRGKDFFLVNDGGKAVNELIMQGMKITPSLDRDFGAFASRFNVAYSDEMFQTGAKAPGISTAVMAIGMCSTLAMTQLLDYSPLAVEESLDKQIGSVLRSWGKKRAKVTENVRVQGLLKQHSFEFLVSPRLGKPPISISILNPTAGSLSAAERFGFKQQDLSKTKFGTWKNLAVETKAEVWSPDAQRIIEKTADEVVRIRSTERAEAAVIFEVLDRMVA